MSRSVRTLAAAAVALLVLHVQPLHAIGPTVLMFYGDPLKKPVLVTGADAGVFADVLRPTTVTAKDTTGRSYISVALFWGSAADPAANGVPLAQLTPQMAWQHGRLYAATASQPALLVTTAFLKQAQAVPGQNEGGVFVSGGPLQPNALAVLQRLGIPTGPAR
jgi:hypothetical protein